MKKKIYFSKFHSLGNDFVIIENITQKNFLYSKNLIKNLSNRKTSIGFDQLLIVEPSKRKNIDFKYKIFNSDGTEVFQCGNGARCFAKYVYIKGFIKNKNISIYTKNRIMFLKIKKKNFVTLNIGPPIFDSKKIPFIGSNSKKFKTHMLEINKKNFFFNVISVGNPHCIIVVKNYHSFNINKIGRLISKNNLFPQEINVSFMKIINKKEIFLRIYERGVGETQSCGSASCAAVVAGSLLNLLKRKNIIVNLLGGNLNVSWKNDNNIYVTGLVVHSYEGYFFI